MPDTAHPAPDFRSRQWRLGNTLVTLFARAGIGPIHLLTVPGRRTGRPQTVPVVPVDENGKRWLVAPYGVVTWVKNAREASTVTLRHGRTTHHYTLREAPPEEAAPVLKRYVTVATKTRAQFTATKDSPASDFLTEAPTHPVFELTPAP